MFQTPKPIKISAIREPSDQKLHDLVDNLTKNLTLAGNSKPILMDLADKNRSNVEQTWPASGLCDEDALLLALAESFDCPLFQEIDIATSARDAFSLLGSDYCLSKNVFPTSNSDGELTLYSSTICDADLLHEIAFILRSDPEIRLAPSRVVRSAIRALINLIEIDDPDDIQASIEVGDVDQNDSRAARAIDQIFKDAVLVRASDVHFGFLERKLTVRFRVNGVLRAQQELDLNIGEEVIARLKYLGGMSITESRLPQDGSCQRIIDGRSLEVRLATMPTQFGESIVCRLLDPTFHRRTWAELGFSKDVEEKFVGLVERPSGLLVIAGPVGSGKTTTIYTALQHLNDGKRKIITVEDPIEQSIPGLDQIQINDAIGFGFGRVLRATLRHDPDVLMIGEVRDEDTAEVACRAALLGRLVLATVHANSIDAAKERFVNLKIPQYLISEVLVGILSQQLLKATCGNCIGKGCGSCFNSGYVGRRLSASIWSHSE